MVWKCPPLHLTNWNQLWRWKLEIIPTSELRDEKVVPADNSGVQSNDNK